MENHVDGMCHLVSFIISMVITLSVFKLYDLDGAKQAVKKLWGESLSGGDLTMLVDNIMKPHYLHLIVFIREALSNNRYNVLFNPKRVRHEDLIWLLSAGYSERKKPLSAIVDIYDSIVDSDNAAEQRENFARENLGVHFFENKDFKKARSFFRDLAGTKEGCKKRFVLSVIEDHDRSMQDLVCCLDMGNCDAATLILDVLEDQKKKVDIRATIFAENFFNKECSNLFFSRFNYELCAKIQLIVGNKTSFFVVPQISDRNELSQLVSERVNIYLEISTDPDVLEHIWRHRRLDLTKQYLSYGSLGVKQISTQKELNLKIFDLLRDARIALDPCVSQFFEVNINSFYPHAFKRMTDKERKKLMKKAGNNEKYDQDRILYLKKRLKEEWLPQNRGTKLKYVVIEGLLRQGFSSLKGKKIPEDILKFFARREYHIITKEAVWHALWIDGDNINKHSSHSWNVRQFEEDLNAYRSISGLLPGHEVSAYDVAHLAAEFAEQTLIVFESANQINN